MKLRVCSFILVLLLAATSCASASDIVSGSYTDASSVMTQDSLLDFKVISENAEEICEISFQQPDAQSMALLEEIFEFVWRSQQRPIEFFDEETRQKIQLLVPDTDLTTLHMTEFMALSMTGVPTEEVNIQMLLDVDYQVGQLVVVVLGCMDENGEYRWFPYLGEVPLTGLIEFVVPKEEYELLTGVDQIIYQAMSVRVGPRGDVIEDHRIEQEIIVTPSKAAKDIVRVIEWYSKIVDTMDDTFGIFLVDKTAAMNQEIVRMGAFLSGTDEQGSLNSIINWFPAELINEAQLLSGEEIDLETMIAYDIVAVISKDYKDTYGDVAAEIQFASAYSPECATLVMLGFPLTEEELAMIPEEELDSACRFEWYCLNTQAIDEGVEIVFKQLVLPRMEQEPAMLIVMSEPLNEVQE